ncbi:hypothetical protein DPMN_002255 [Dreissena polymorpha]|uniref:Uncharacterized protein n=1 Tax=Dreissena polymorpha TaxID=45954 RepID=A0A9D4MMS7_DREPO|nr:hypothetical protein DPMN_002255 [Dreissena polymorpha]
MKRSYTGTLPAFIGAIPASDRDVAVVLPGSKASQINPCSCRWSYGAAPVVPGAAPVVSGMAR